MEDFIRFLDDFPASLFNFHVFIGIIVAVFVFIVELVCIRSFTKYDGNTAKAIHLGHVVKAKRTRIWKDDMGGTSADSWWYGLYTYKVEGKTYRYKHMSRRPCPLSMKLYYLDNPGNAFSGKEYSNPVSVLFFLAPITAGMLVIYLLGRI